jgi:hypothetical protein
MIPRSLCPSDAITRVLAERLRGCLPSEELRALIGSRDIDWGRVVGHASAELVLPAFAAALSDLGLRESLDPELGAFLDAVRAANAERNHELRAELAAAVAILNRADVEPVLLKGTIRLLDRVYPDDGWRMSRDLDLLVSKASLREAKRAFQNAGYAECGSHGALHRPGGACQIDLHTELFCRPRQLRLLPAADVLEGARHVAVGNGRVGVPSIEHQVVHLIGHGQIRHLGHAFGRISLRNCLEAAALVQWGHEAIDWPAVSQRFVATRYQRPFLVFVLALNQGGWCAVPLPGRIDRLAAAQWRRIALQARSATAAYVGSRLGLLISEFTRQLEEAEGGQSRALANLRRLLSERGAARRMGRAIWERQRHLVHVSPYLTWLIAQ